jgi:translocation and assembly module TamB
MRNHKITRSIIVIAPVTIVILLLAATVLLHSKAFQGYALKRITETASQSTGLQVHIQNMTAKWYPFAIEFTGITARSPAAMSVTPLLSAARVQIGLRLWPLLRRDVQIQDLIIVRPSIYVRTESDGRTNLPPANPEDKSSNSGLGVQVTHFVIQDGLLQYDNRQIPLSAELQGFRAQIAFNRSTNVYKGKVAYDVGRLQTAGARTFDHEAKMQFTADARHWVIERVDLSTMHSHLRAGGELTEYSNPVFKGDYQAYISTDDVRWILRNGTLPSGEISLQGKLNYRTASGPTWVDRTVVEGQLESTALSIPSGKSRVAIRALYAPFRLEHGLLNLQDARAEVLGGHFSSDSSVVDLANNAARLHLILRGVSVEQAIEVVSAGEAQTPRIASLADLDVQAAWKGSPSTAIAHVGGILRQIPTSTTIAIPIEGNFALDYDATKNRASFQPSTLRTGTTQVTASGVLSRDSTLRLGLTTSDLHELSALISAIAPSTTSQRLSAYDLHGAAQVTGNLGGSVSDPHFDGQLTATDLQLANTKWRTVRAHVAVDSKSVAIDDGSIVNNAQGRMNFDGNTRLSNWSLDPNAPLTLHAHIEQLSATDLQRLASVTYPVEGLLTGDLAVSGSHQHPAARGHLELTEAVVWSEPLNTLALNLNADKQTIRVNADVRAPAGRLAAHGEYEPSARRYQVSANTRGINLEKLYALQRSVGALTGTLSADLSGNGTLDNPQLSARVGILDLQLHGQGFQKVDASLDVRNKHSEFRIHSAVEETVIDAKGTVELAPGYPVNATLDTGTIPIGQLLARYAPRAQQANGQMQIHAALQGPLQTPLQLQAHAEIPTLQLQADTVTLSNAGPIRIDYRAGVVQITGAQLKGEGTDLRLNGSIPVQGPGTMNVSADANVDLKALQPWTNGGHSSGRLTVQLHARGPKEKPAIDGRVQIANALYTSDALPVGIEDLNGEMSIEGNRLNISTLSAKAGGGLITVTGAAVYGQTSDINLALRAKSVRIRQDGVRAVMDADLAWTGSTSASTLAGRVAVDKLAFNEGSDLSEILGQFSDEIVREPSEFARTVKLNVAVQSAQNLNLESSQLSIAGSADLSARGTLAQPVILGRVTLTGGEVFFLGKRFEIDSGTIAFSNPARTEPVVNLRVKTTVEQYNITANLTGPIDRLTTTYTSDPTLPTADIINLLAFGQTTTEAASKGSAPASVGAQSAVAGAVGGQVASQVQKLTGISQLTLNPLAGNQNPGAQVAIQQRVSGNVLLTFSTDITSAQSQAVQIQYQVRRNISVSVLRDENGGYGINVQYHKVF